MPEPNKDIQQFFRSNLSDFLKTYYINLNRASIYGLLVFEGAMPPPILNLSYIKWMGPFTFWHLLRFLPPRKDLLKLVSSLLNEEERLFTASNNWGNLSDLQPWWTKRLKKFKRIILENIIKRRRLENVNWSVFGAFMVFINKFLAVEKIQIIQSILSLSTETYILRKRENKTSHTTN